MIRPKSLCSLGEVCAAIECRCDPGSLFMILTAYLDESGTHAGSPAMVMAAMLGSSQQWQKFEAELGGMRKKYRFNIFHGKDLKARRGEFLGWDDHKCLSLVSDLSEAIGHLLMEGAIFTLDMKQYEEEYRQPSFPKMSLDSAYGLSFRVCIHHLVDEIIRRLGHHKKFEQTKLNVVLEHGHKNSGDALRIFGDIKKSMILSGNKLLGPCKLAKKEEALPLMVSDFLAYTTYQEHIKATPQTVIDNTAPPSRPQKAGLRYLRYPPGELVKTRHQHIENKRLK